MRQTALWLRITTLIALYASVKPAYGVENLLVRGLEVPPFVVDSLRFMQFPGKDAARRDLFFSKIDSILLCGEGKINILHIGGSHVQADVISHTVRCHLDSINGDLKPARGVFFPFQAAKTNNPSNFKVRSKGEWIASRNLKKERLSKIGMTGIALTTEDPQAEIKVNLDIDSTNRWDFTRLRLLGYGDSLSVPILVEEDESFRFPIQEEETASFIYEFKSPIDSFQLRIVQADSIPHRFNLCGFVAENDNDGIVYHSIGVNGAAVPSYLSCENFERDIQLIKPDMVVFAIGINDAIPVNFSEQQFIANYDTLIQKFNRVNPECFYVFITNNDSFRKTRRNRKTRYVVNRNGLTVEHAFYTLAQKYNGGYWDLFGWMGGLESMRLWEKAGLAQKDKIHFTKKGYKLIGSTFYNALITSYLER